MTSVSQSSYCKPGLRTMFERHMPEVRRIANRLSGRRGCDHTVCRPSVLVGEAFVRMATGKVQEWRDARHFLASTARCMRHAVIDHKRRADTRRKHQSKLEKRYLERMLSRFGSDRIDIEQLSLALDRLGAMNPTMREAIELRFFLGLKSQDVRRLLELEEREYYRQWQAARVWLAKEMGLS